MSETPDFYTKSGLPSRIKHGTETAYINMKCRCDLCKAERAKKVRARSLTPRRPEPEHGEPRMYDRGCRCEKCKAGRAAYVKELRGIAKYSATFEV